MTFPTDIPIRLSRLSELAGEPLSTLQQAISEGELRAAKKGRSWYVSLDWFRDWIEGEASQSPFQSSANTSNNNFRIALVSLYSQSFTADSRRC